MILLEYTDTFGGEANYCWVERHEIADTSLSIRKILQTAREVFGINTKLRMQYDTGLERRYNLQGCCRCLFIVWSF